MQSTIECNINANSLAVTCLENGDELLMLNQSSIMSSDSQMGDTPCSPTARNLSCALQVPMVLLSATVPDQEDWTFDEVAKTAINILSTPRDARLFMFQHENLSRFMCVADGFETAYGLFQKSLIGDASQEQTDQSQRFALCADATLHPGIASTWIGSEYLQSRQDRHDLDYYTSLLKKFCADLFEDEVAMSEYLLGLSEDGHAVAAENGLYW